MATIRLVISTGTRPACNRQTDRQTDTVDTVYNSHYILYSSKRARKNETKHFTYLQFTCSYLWSERVAPHRYMFTAWLLRTLQYTGTHCSIPDLKLISFTNPFLRNPSGSFWTVFTDLKLYRKKLAPAFLLYFLFLATCAGLSWPHSAFWVHAKLFYHIVSYMTATAEKQLTV